MPKIKDPHRNMVAVFEDPRPARNQIYFYGDAHDKSTLAPIFNKHAKFGTSYQPINRHGYSTWGGINAGGMHGGAIVTTKECATINGTTNTGNSVHCNIMPGQMLSMDPDRPYRPAMWTSENGVTNLLVNSTSGASYSREHKWWSNIDTDAEISEVSITGLYNYTGAPGTYTEINHPGEVLYKMPGTNYYSGIYHRDGGSQRGNVHGNFHRVGLMRPNFPNWTSTDIGTRRDYNFFQFIGPSDIDSRPIYLLTDYRYDRTHYIVRHNVDLNTETVLHTFNTIPSASGSNYGGERATNAGLDQQHKASSKIFDDVLSAGNKAWYTPYFDTSNNYFPFYFQWEKSTDTFVRNEDVTVSGNLSSTYLNDGLGIQGGYGSFNSVLYNEVHSYGGNKYITLFPLEGSYAAHDAVPGGRTFVTYSIDASNPKALTHHSHEIATHTIKNVIWLNDSRTLLGVFHQSNFAIYNFDSVNGWTESGRIPYGVGSVGRDSTDRIFAFVNEGDTYGTVHQITPTVPINVTITPAQSSYNYTGTNINSTIAVSAYGIDGTRIATTVNLSISGSTLTFTGGATTATVTTSTSADVNVDIVVTGAGLSDILANIDV